MLFYETEGRRLDPNLVLLVVFVGNDVMGNTEGAFDMGGGPVPKPRFRLIEGALEADLPGEKAAAAWTRPRPQLEAVKDWIAERSALYRAGRSAWANLLRWLGPRAVPHAWQHFRRDETPATQEAWAVTEALLSRLNDDIERDGRKLAIAIVPDEIQVRATEWRSFLDFYQLDPDEWDPAVPSRRFARTCEVRGLRCLDLLPALRAHRADPYLPRGGHLNAIGHRVVAEALVDWLAGRDMVPRR